MLIPHALRTSTWRRPRPEATLHCSVKSSEISSMNPESVHTIVLGPFPSLGQVRLYQLEITLHHHVHHGYRRRSPEISVEDLDLDVTAIPCGRNGFGEGRKVDVA